MSILTSKETQNRVKRKFSSLKWLRNVQRYFLSSPDDFSLNIQIVNKNIHTAMMMANGMRENIRSGIINYFRLAFVTCIEDVKSTRRFASFVVSVR
jgi:hypothetical protein